MEKFFLTIGPAATRFLLFLMFFTVIFIPLEIHAESGGILIGNSSVSAEALSKTDVMNIFLGKKTTWDK